MSFIWIDMLWLLFLVPILVGVYILIQRRRQKYALRYASLSMVKEALGRGPGRRRHVPAILFLIGLAIMIGALARPSATVMLPSQQGTIILTIDVSGSMRAEDVKPNRIEAAKAAALTFIEKQPRNVRIGIVSFSGYAAVVQSPTTDREALTAAINRLTPQRQTAIGSGIITSLDAIFEEPGAKPKQPASPRDPLMPSNPNPNPTPKPSVPKGSYAPAIVVLLSDGQSNAGISPLDAAEQAANRGVRVYTIGLGTPDGTILTFEGWSVRVRLDETTLKRVAEKTGGEYFRASSDNDLREIYGNLGTQLVFKSEQTELTAGFTALAAVLLLVAGALSLLWFHRLP